MKRKPISWILEFTSNLPNEEEKIKCLRANDHPAIKTILQYCFNPNVKWTLPEDEPPYKPNEFPDSDNILYAEAKRLYLFVEGGNTNLTGLKKESLFIKILEEVTPGDAKLLLSIKNKVLPYPGLTKETVKKAFPELF